MIEASDNEDTIAPKAIMRGTVRSLDESARDLIEARLKILIPGIAQAFGASAEISYLRDYPVTWNDPQTTEMFATTAGKITKVDSDITPLMISEDFGFFAAAVPASFGFLGMGDGPGLHDPSFDFDDDLLPLGVRIWLSLLTCRT